MANFMYSGTHNNFAVVTANPAENSSFPKTRMSDREYPLRQSRSTAVAQQDYVLDFTSALASATYYIGFHHTNFTAVELAHGDVASPTTDASFVSNTAHTLAHEKFTGRYKGFFAKTISKRYLRVRIPNQSPTDNASYLACGLITVSSSPVTLARNPKEPVPITIGQQRIGQRIARSPRYIERMTWGWDYLSESDLDEVRTLGLLGSSTLFVTFFNRGHDQEVFLLYRPAEPEYALRLGLQTDAHIDFREWAGPINS